MYRSKTLIIILFLSFISLFADDKAITTGDLKKAQNAQKQAEINFDILSALELQDKNPKAALELYKQIYKKTDSEVYLKEAIKIAFFIKDEKNLSELLGIGEKRLADDSDFLRIKIANLISKGKFEESSGAAKKLLGVEKTAKNYSVLGSILYGLGDYENSLKNFESAYEKEKSEENLIRIVDILVNRLNEKSKAISFLETHRRIYGCGNLACAALADIYRIEKRYDDVIKIDEAQYLDTNDTTHLDDIVSIHYHFKDYDKIIEILKKYPYNKELLIDAYGKKGDYSLAMKTARDEFKNSGNYDFLAIEAIYEYESMEKNINKNTLNSVVEKFENIAPQLKNPIYLNYYGYILIDHDLDIKKGMEFVEKALEIEPNSAYYIDSLAWGYFKLGNCKKAKSEMDKITDKEFFKSDEGKEHINAINGCLQKAGK
ncbi:MAG: tetratricopeptide repeat protein [Campylobacter sp.]|nr:tetratricopeptide repeat protein [Campylobacter sp.]